MKRNNRWSHNPSEYNPPSRRLHHWRHHQWNFMIARFQIHNDRSSCRVTIKHIKQLDWPSWKHTNERGTRRRSPCRARARHRLTSDDSSRKTGGSDSISHTRNERKGWLGTCETLGKEPPFRQVTEKIAFPSNTEPSGAPECGRQNDLFRLQCAGFVTATVTARRISYVHTTQICPELQSVHHGVALRIE